MQDDKAPRSRSFQPAQLFWILGMVVGIAAGSFVAFGIAARVESPVTAVD